MLAHPETDDLGQLGLVDLHGAKRVTHPVGVPDTTFNICSGWYHCLSTYLGLLQVETEFAIKVRSDIFVGNLQPMIDRLQQFPDRYISSNVYFRPDRITKFHPSDQLVGMKTSVFLETMAIAMFRLENHSLELSQVDTDPANWASELPTYYPGKLGHKKPNADEGMGGGLGCTPEIVFGTSYLAAKGISQIPSESKNIMREHFSIVRLEDMFPYRDKFGNVDRIAYGGIPIINHIDEV